MEKQLRRKTRTVRLQIAAWVVSVLLVVISLSGVSTIVPLGRFIHSETNELKLVEKSVRLARTLKVRLLEHNKAAIGFIVTREGTFRETMDKTRHEALDALGTLKEIEHDPTELELLARSDTAIRQYFSVSQALFVRHLPTAKALPLQMDALESSISGVDAVVEAEVNDVETTQRKFSTLNSYIDWVGILLAAFILAGSLAVLWQVRVLLVRPLQRLDKSISAFRTGNRHSRASDERVFEVNKIANAFNEMADELAHIEERRLEFLAGVAHDIRNPLAALKIAAAVVQRGVNIPRETLLETMKLMSDQVVRIDRLVGDFLDGARVEGGKFSLHIKEASPVTIIQATVSLWQPLARHKINVRMSQKAASLQCDAGRVEQVLNNLISNAAKYSPSDQTIEISLKQDENKTVISVRDHGMGINDTDLESIFQPFRRTQKARDLVAGVGLGLSVSKKIVEAHGGKLLVESQPGVGSTFSIVLPNRQDIPLAA